MAEGNYFGFAAIHHDFVQNLNLFNFKFVIKFFIGDAIFDKFLVKQSTKAVVIFLAFSKKEKRGLS